MSESVDVVATCINALLLTGVPHLAMEDDDFLPHADLEEMVAFVENLTGGLMDDSDDDLELDITW